MNSAKLLPIDGHAFSECAPDNQASCCPRSLSPTCTSCSSCQLMTWHPHLNLEPMRAVRELTAADGGRFAKASVTTSKNKITDFSASDRQPVGIRITKKNISSDSIWRFLQFSDENSREIAFNLRKETSCYGLAPVLLLGLSFAGFSGFFLRYAAGDFQPC